MMNLRKAFLTSLTAVVAACAALAAQDAGEGFAKRIKITASGYNGSGLENVPALVRLSPEKIEGFSYEDFKLENGGDLRFTTADGTPLAHEIDTWNKDGESLVWVKVPSMAKDVKIIAYFGNESPWAVDAKDVWSDYIGVYHMSETCDASTAATTLAMSSTGKYNAEPNAKSTATKSEMVSTPGKIGLGRVNISNASSKNALTIPDTNAEECNGVFTVSGWFYMRKINGDSRLMTRKSSSGSAGGWELGMNGSETRGFYRGGDGTAHFVTFDGLSSKWSFLTLVFNGTTVDIYQNGVWKGGGGITAAADNGLGTSFGNYTGCGDSSFYGSYDEARLSKGAMTAARVKFDYDTVAGTIFTYGGVESNVSVTLTITNDDTKQTYVATVDGVPVASGAKVSENALVTIVVTPVEGYEYAALPEGWSAGETAGTITRDFTAATDPTEIEIPDAKVVVQKVALTITNDETKQSYVALVDGVPVTDAKVDINSKVTVVVTPQPGYGYTALPEGWNAGETKGTITRDFTAATDPTVIEIPSAVLCASEGFAKRMTITASGYSGSGLENVPSLVRLSSENIKGFSYGDFALENGGDLRFTAGDGTPLAHEIDTWNPKGESLVWVKVPSMAKNAKIIAYFGNAEPWAVDATKVWSDYIGVYHMSETCDASTAAATLAMSSTGKYDAAPNASSKAPSEMVSADGKIGLGRVNISSTSSQNALTIPNPDEEDACDGVFTVSGWFYTTGANGASRIITRKNSMNDSNGWEMGLNGNTSAGFYRGGSSAHSTVNFNDLSSKWSFLTLVYNGTKVDIYQNGVRKGGSSSIAKATDNGLGISFGNYSNCSEKSFYGKYDEARLSKGAMTAERVKFDYDTVAGTIFTYGDVEDATTEETVKVMITASADKVVYTATVIGAPVGETVASNAIVSVVATPKEGYIYFTLPENWQRKDGGAITRDFTAETDPTVIEIPDPQDTASVRYMLTLGACVGGSITGKSGECTYHEKVTLTAVPETGYEFVEWTGDASGTENPLEITMDADKTISATFKKFSYIKNGSFEYGAKQADGVTDVPYGKSLTDFTRPTGWTGGFKVYRGTYPDRRGNNQDGLLWDGSGIDTNLGVVRDGWYCLAVDKDAPLSTEITIDKHGRYEFTLWNTVKYSQTGAGDVYLYLDDQRVCKIGMPKAHPSYPNYLYTTGWNKQTMMLNLQPGTYTLKLQVGSAGFVMLFDDLSLIYDQPLEPGDADLLTVSDYDGDTALDATVNLPNSGRYRFSCRYLRRGDNDSYDQDAVLKIDDTVVATVPTTTEKSAWLTFTSDQFNLKKGEHRIVIEGSSGKRSVLKLDQIRLDFIGGSGLLLMFN